MASLEINSRLNEYSNQGESLALPYFKKQIFNEVDPHFNPDRF